MKKSVVILIGIIYAASILLVTFYGLVTENLLYDSVDVTDIEIVGEDVVKWGEQGQKYYAITTPLTPDEPLTYQIEYTISPDNATNTKVVFIIEEESAKYASVDENGLVTIFAPGEKDIHITVYATDSEGNIDTSVKDEIWISYPY